MDNHGKAKQQMKMKAGNFKTLTNCISISLFLVITNPSKASSVTWVGGDGTTPNSWKDANNWNTGSTPGSQDDITIPATDHNPIMDATSSINSLTICGSGTTLTLDGIHNLTVAGNVDVAGINSQLLTGKGIIIIGGSVSGQGKLDLTGNGTAQIAGNMSINTFVAGPGGKSVILLNGSLQNIVNNYQFNNLQVGVTAATTVNMLADQTINVALNGSGNLNCNNHTLNITGDMTLKTFYADSGTVNLTGMVNFQSQDINGYSFYNLSVDNTKTYLTGNVSISHNLNFISGNILLRSYNFTILPGATINWNGSQTPDNTSGYFVTCSTGYLTMTATINGTIFPIGYSMTEYNPITLASTSGSVLCDAGVSDAVTDVIGNPVTSNAVNETWHIIPHSNVASISISTQWTDGSSGDPNQELSFFNRALAELNERTSQTNPSPWTTIGPAGQSTGGDPWSRSSGSISMIANTSYYFYVNAGSIAPLPVTLTTFDVNYEGAFVTLKWITASEINNDHFEIERSMDGMTWKTIGILEGHGTTQEENGYLAIDNLEGLVATGTIYYRLKQVDFNGNFTYSMIRSVNIENIPISIAMYPNPVRDLLNVRWSSPEGSSVSIRILNQNGIMLYNLITTGSGMMQKQINMAGYANGNYILEVVTEGQVTSKLISKE